jgi:hypothetical protein
MFVEVLSLTYHSPITIRRTSAGHTLRAAAGRVAAASRARTAPPWGAANARQISLSSNGRSSCADEGVLGGRSSVPPQECANGSGQNHGGLMRLFVVLTGVSVLISDLA